MDSPTASLSFRRQCGVLRARSSASGAKVSAAAAAAAVKKKNVRKNEFLVCNTARPATQQRHLLHSTVLSEAPPPPPPTAQRQEQLDSFRQYQTDRMDALYRQARYEGTFPVMKLDNTAVGAGATAATAGARDINSGKFTPPRSPMLGVVCQSSTEDLLWALKAQIAEACRHRQCVLVAKNARQIRRWSAPSAAAAVTETPASGAAADPKRSSPPAPPTAANPHQFEATKAYVSALLADVDCILRVSAGSHTPNGAKTGFVHVRKQLAKIGLWIEQ